MTALFVIAGVVCAVWFIIVDWPDDEDNFPGAAGGAGASSFFAV